MNKPQDPELTELRAGWVFASCDECGGVWCETTRDIKAPSSVQCPYGCDHGGDPHVWAKKHTTLVVDSSGNLLEHQIVKLNVD
jgi:hypothetical protein